MGSTRSPTRSAAAALLAVLVMAGCSSAAQGAARSGPQPATGGSGAVPTAARTTAADVRFMSMMIGHHAQAVEMARMVPTHGASASVRTLAARILNAQEDEIATMQQWLRDRGQPVPEAHAPGAHGAHSAGHGAHGANHGAAPETPMHGMLSQAQMKQLDQARGAEFDRLFLTFMIQHHRGAVEMVNELLSSYGAAQDQTVFKLASDVNVDQTTEIDRMQKMLATFMLEGRLP